MTDEPDCEKKEEEEVPPTQSNPTLEAMTFPSGKISCPPGADPSDVYFCC
jgi:hypothetical protein